MMEMNGSQNHIEPGAKMIIKLYLATIACITLFFIVMINLDPPIKRNICSVAEISPDVTPEERKECRMIRGHKL